MTRGRGAGDEENRRQRRKEEDGSNATVTKSAKSGMKTRGTRTSGKEEHAAGDDKI